MGQYGMPPEPDNSGGSSLCIPDANEGVSEKSSLKHHRRGHAPSLPTSLDSENQTCNDDENDENCKLPDDYPPSPEWQFPPISGREARFWHSSHQRERKAIYHALRTMGKYRQIHTFVNCGSDVRVLFRLRIGDVPQIRLAANRCKNRFCPLCSRCRSTVFAANVSALIRERACRVRMVTLTLRHSDTPLRDQIRRLTQCFNNLKRRSWWKDKVSGGVMFTELKIGKDGRWHVHCHIIAESSFLPIHELSNEWHAVTGDSPIVDVREIESPEKAGGYVAKYGSKPCDPSVLYSPEKLIEAIEALKGVRLATTFGEWRGKKLTSSSDDTDNVGWEEIGTLHSIMTTEWWPWLKRIRPDMAERIEQCSLRFNKPSG
jgi:hypothetical protein